MKNRVPVSIVGQCRGFVCKFVKRVLKYPEFGYPCTTQWLRDYGYGINRKQIARLMRRTGL